MNEKDFLNLWNKSLPGQKFRFILNYPLFGGMIAVMLLIFSYLIYIGIESKFENILINIAILIYFFIFLYFIFLFLRFRLRSRTDGIIINKNGIVVRQGFDIFELKWNEVSKDNINFVSSSDGKKSKYETFLAIKKGEKEYKILMFNPFLRIDSLENFMKEFLVNLKKRGKNG